MLQCCNVKESMMSALRKSQFRSDKILSSISVNHRSAHKTTQNWLVMYYKSSLSIFLHSFGRVRKCSACAFAKDRSYLSPSHLPNPKARGKEGKRGGPSTYLPTRLTSPAPLSSTLDSLLHYIVASGAKFHKRCRF